MRSGRSTSTLGALLGSLLACWPSHARAELGRSTLSGTVALPDQSPAARAAVELQDHLGAVIARTHTDASGRFRVEGLPAGDYYLRAAVPERLVATRRVALRGAREELALTLTAQGTESVTVSGEVLGPDGRAGLAPRSLQRLDDRLRSRGLRDALAKAAGWPREDNGLVHHRGADDGFLFVLDGVPVYERLDPLFGLSPDVGSLASLEVLSGYVPPRYGLRSAAVVELRTTSAGEAGPGGEASVQAGSEDTRGAAGSLSLPLGSAFRLLSSGAIEGSSRFLDPVDPGNLHNRGHTWRLEAATVWREGERDRVAARAGFGESDFEVPNEAEQDEGGQDQGQDESARHLSLTWFRALDAITAAEVIAYGRQARSRLAPSPFDTPLRVDARRRVSRAGLLAHLTAERGRHRFVFGLEGAVLDLSERFAFAVVDAEEGREADLSEAALQFTPTNPFRFQDGVRRSQLSLFVQDSFRAGDRLQVEAGLRFDATRLLSPEEALSPRLGLAYRLASSVRLRASANRFFQPPQSEWLLLSASPEARVLSPFAETGGGAPPRAERQWSYEAGVETWLGPSLRLDLALWHRAVRSFLDPNVFFGTTIIFPNSAEKGRARGLDVRLELPSRRGFSGFLAYSRAQVIQVGPINGGLFLEDDIIEIGPGTEFRPDHDIPNTATGALRFEAPSGRFEATLSGRYQSGTPLELSDEGLQELAERPGFDLVDVEAGRVKPHFVVDAVFGARLFRAGSVSLRGCLAVHNLTDRRFAFNFGNPFSGTHFGPPRTFWVGLDARFD